MSTWRPRIRRSTIWSNSSAPSLRVASPGPAGHSIADPLVLGRPGAFDTMARMATYAHFETTLGNFTVELFDDKAPKTVANFAGLAEGSKEWRHPKTGAKHTSPFYDGISFHRVIDGFVIQGGD